MTAWTDLVKKIYEEHKGEAGYKLGDAMKEAKKQYKKGSVEKTEPVEVKPKSLKKKRRKARKSQKNKK